VGFADFRLGHRPGIEIIFFVFTMCTYVANQLSPVTQDKLLVVCAHAVILGYAQKSVLDHHRDIRFALLFFSLTRKLMANLKVAECDRIQWARCSGVRACVDWRRFCQF
jgi:hypothetical protein